MPELWNQEVCSRFSVTPLHVEEDHTGAWGDVLRNTRGCGGKGH